MGRANVGVSWFEIPVHDVARAAQFYSVAMDTELAEIPGPDGKPLQVFVGEHGPSGALMSGEGYTPGSAGALIYLGCDDIDAVLARVPAAGGSVLQERLSIGEYGSIGLLTDSEGNRIALHQD